MAIQFSTELRDKIAEAINNELERWLVEGDTALYDGQTAAHVYAEVILIEIRKWIISIRDKECCEDAEEAFEHLLMQMDGDPNEV